jgi:hypothetical protein
MNRFRALVSQSPAIVISIVALTFSLGGGAGYAATVATGTPAVVKIAWHPLALTNKWAPAAKGFAVGRPAYTVSNGVVYLTGVAARANQSLPIPSVIGVLPKGARPTHNLWFAAYNYAAAGQSSIEVARSGAVEVFGNGGDENFFTSLAGIQFPLGA